MDLNQRFTYINPSISNLLGYSIGEAMAISPRELLVNGSSEVLMGIISEELIKLGADPNIPSNSRQIVVELSHKDGSVIKTQLNVTLLRDHLGKPTEILCVAHDITDIKSKTMKMEHELKELRETFDAIPDIVALVSPEFKIIRLNKEGYIRTGLKPKEQKIKKCYEIMHGTDAPIDECPCEKSLETKKTTNGEFEQGGCHFIATAAPIFDVDDNLIAFAHTIKDISEHKRAEEQVENSLKEKIVLFTELKHRVNNNLQLLLSMVNMWIMETEVPAVREALQEMAGIITAMALVHSEAQVDPGAKRIRLKEFMRELTKGVISIKAHSGLKVTYSVEGDEIWLELEQANPLSLLTNELLVNSLKHAFNGRQTGHIEVSLSENNGTVKVSIKDNGVGMSLGNDLKKANSLGLELVQSLVEQLHGNLEIIVNNGTNFIIEFPKGGWL